MPEPMPDAGAARRGWNLKRRKFARLVVCSLASITRNAASNNPAGARGVSSSMTAMSCALTRKSLPNWLRVIFAPSRNCATASPNSSNCRATAYCGSLAIWREWNCSRSSLINNHASEDTASCAVQKFPIPGAAFSGFSSGNGRIGTMVFGGTDTEHLQLNEDIIWSGGPYQPARATAHGVIQRVRELVFKGPPETSPGRNKSRGWRLVA